MATETYSSHVEALEARYAEYAFTTRKVQVYANGDEAIGSLEKQWESGEGRARLIGRTPMTLERDRILYSDALRRQADKHHVLFWNQQRVSRNYTNHTLRIAQVSRSIASRLNLNTDLAEAIALGAKVGGVSFLHQAKSIVAQWVQDSIAEIDKHSQVESRTAVPKTPRVRVGTKAARVPGAGQQGLEVSDDNELILPSWIKSIRSEQLRDQVMEWLPWAAGDFNGKPYSSGQESYWMLATDPFQERLRRPYLPQTLYGIWRHSLEQQPSSDFHHLVSLKDPGTGDTRQLQFSQEDLTHEAIVVRFADDITWVIENLSEAARAAALDGKPFAVMTDLARTLRSEAPASLGQALNESDTGFLYTFFIDDLVRISQAALDQNGEVSETTPTVKLSDTGDLMLGRMKGYLEDRVFTQDRTIYRNGVLGALTKTVLDVLIDSPDALLSLTKRRSMQDGWSEADFEIAKQRLDEPVKRIQSCVDLLVTMSDREIYDFIGLD